MKKLGFSSYSYWKNLQLKQFILRYFNIIPVHLKWDQRKVQYKVRIKNCLEKNLLVILEAMNICKQVSI